MLDRILGQQPGVIRGATGNHENLVDLAQFLIGEPLFVQHDPAVDEMPEQGVGHRGGLLGDLLEHEVLVATLFGGGQVPVDVKSSGTFGQIVAVEVVDPVAVGGDHHGLVLAELDRVAGVSDEGGDVGADEHLALADADHQRRGATRRDNGARFVGVGEYQGEVALEAAQHGQHGGAEITCGLAVAVLLGDQVDGHLGVGVAGEFDSGDLQLVAQGRVVLDDAVVDDGDFACCVAMRVRVAVGGTSVRGPASVTETGAPGQCRGVGLGERALQVGQSAGSPTYRELADPVDQRHSRRVVTAVLHPAQRVDDDAKGRLMPDVADDSAHSPSG